MKQLLIFISLLLSILNAEILPNTGLQQNNLGYYGEGVTFGGLAIIGDWYLQSEISSDLATLNIDGSATRFEDSNLFIYGVSEDGLSLHVSSTSPWYREIYSINSEGNNGCFVASNNFASDIGYVTSALICKVNVNSKTYGPSSNRVTITVNSE